MKHGERMKFGFIAFIPVNDGGFFDDFWRDQKRYCFWTSEIYETMI